jgi:hypothetical protein
MSSVRDLLERAERSAPPTSIELADLERRRDRRRTRQRLGTTIVALGLTATVAGGAFAVLREHPGSTAGTSGPTGALPPATAAPLVAGAGEFYYSEVYFVTGCPAGEESLCAGADNLLSARIWWREDGSGAIAVEEVRNYGIDEGIFGPGEFPNGNGIDVSDFPTDPARLAEYLLERSQPDGASPAPLVTPPPEGGPEDGRMWRAITDLLVDPNVTPTLRAALLEVGAGLQGSHVESDVADPVGRPAHVVEFGNWGGELLERLYVDPASHELLAWTRSAPVGDEPFSYWVIELAGLATETDVSPEITSIPEPATELPDVRATPTVSGQVPPSPVPVEECSQGGPDLELTFESVAFDVPCLAVEAGAPFTITLRVEDPGVKANAAIYEPGSDDAVFRGEIVTGPATITYEVPALEPGDYVVVDDVHPNAANVPLYAR